jgi:hypothetical protein
VAQNWSGCFGVEKNQHRLISGKEPVPVVQKGGSTSWPVGTAWKILSPPEIEPQTPPASSLVAIPNLPSRQVTVNTRKLKKKHTTAREGREGAKEMKEAKRKGKQKKRRE